jgi:hypothetical protein
LLSELYAFITSAVRAFDNGNDQPYRKYIPYHQKEDNTRYQKHGRIAYKQFPYHRTFYEKKPEGRRDNAQGLSRRIERAVGSVAVDIQPPKQRHEQKHRLGRNQRKPGERLGSRGLQQHKNPYQKDKPRTFVNAQDSPMEPKNFHKY